MMWPASPALERENKGAKGERRKRDRNEGKRGKEAMKRTGMRKNRPTNRSRLKGISFNQREVSIPDFSAPTAYALI
jgi:hypothetical protein